MIILFLENIILGAREKKGYSLAKMDYILLKRILTKCSHVIM